MRMAIPLASFPAGVVTPGRYEFPFTVFIPDTPSTMHAAGSGGHCSIRYKMLSQLSRPGMCSWNVKTVRQVIVSAPARRSPAKLPAFMEPQTTKVKLLCCINRGTMALGATVDDTVCGRGSSVSVGMACKNDSTVASGTF